jgi:hypothetical protein
MVTVRIEHRIHDFDAWKSAFDRDPAGRQQSGVRRYRISRPVDDQQYILIDLDFDSLPAAEAFLATMRAVWQSPQAGTALLGSPQARIVEEVGSMEY